MKRSLRAVICVSAIALLCINASYAQVKGDPQMKGKVQQVVIQKPNSKLSPALQSLRDKVTGKVQNNALAARPVTTTDALAKFMQIKGDKVVVDFSAKGDVGASKAELQKMGVTITGVYGRVISGIVSISALTQLESATTIRFVKPAYKPRHQYLQPKVYQFGSNYPSPKPAKSGEVISQGDTAMYSYLARKKYHVTGDGVKVGVISDSYNDLGTAEKGVKHGELPGKNNPDGYKKPVQVIEDLDSGGTDEGRAMMEIVHDVAPGSDLAFYTAYNGEADFAQGIQTLADNGCNIIGDDILYFDEPFFQDGIIAQSVDIAKQRGVSYFSAAGNQAIESYESVYRPSTYEPFGEGSGTAHNFSGPSDTPRYFQPIYIPTGGSMVTEFQWDQSSYSASGVGATSDFDIYLTDLAGNIVAVGGSDNLASGEPSELFGFTNNTDSVTFFLTIVKYAGPDPKFLKYILYDDAEFYLTKTPIPGILTPTLVGHPKAAGAIAMGAAWYLNTPAYGLDTPYVEYFSSEGGVPNYFDINGNRIKPLIRKKPDVVAPDGGNTSFFDPFGDGDISEDADSYPNFFGTSAATPHAAGVAALMIEAQKLNTITPDQIKGVLQSTAVDMDDINLTPDVFDKGFDFNTGYGLINAEKAVGKVDFPNLYINNLTLEPTCSDNPLSERDWVIINPNPFPVDASWFVEGTKQSGTITAAPGKTTFTTATISLRNIPLPNIAVLSWKDNFDFTRVDAEFSTKAKCGKDDLSADNSDKSLADRPSTGDAAAVNLADVYPNPSSKTFRVYLSLASQQATALELYSIDGRKLLSKTVYQSNGVVDIDAGIYKPGVYLLNIKQGSFTKTIKLIKQ